MKPLNKDAGEFTPEVKFDPSSSTLSLRGKSLPINEVDFFTEIIQWVEQYTEQPNDSTKMEIDLKYMNARSIRSILVLLKKLQTISESGKNVEIEWSIPKDADDMLEISEDIFTGIQLPHKIVLN